MKKHKISIIAAIGQNRELGKDNKLLWHIPEDFKRFKKITAGHAVIMGRKTFESLGKPLPQRLNIVVTRDKAKLNPTLINQLIGVRVCGSLPEAIDLAKRALPNDEEIFIIGGGQIYQQAIGLADKLYLTLVEGSFEADTFFPDYSQFKNVIFKQCGEYSNYKYTFLELEK